MASLLVALSLLTSAATAHAECAWVLWKTATTASGGSISVPHDSYNSLQECQAALQAGGMKSTAALSAVCLPDTVDPRGPKGKWVTQMTLLAELEEFVRDHRAHGALTGDATEPAWNGYLLTVACPCGVTFERWITPAEADADLRRLASLNWQSALSRILRSIAGAERIILPTMRPRRWLWGVAIRTVSAIRSVSPELARSSARRVWSAPCPHFPAPGTSLPRACPLGALRAGALLQVASAAWCRLWGWAGFQIGQRAAPDQPVSSLPLALEPARTPGRSQALRPGLRASASSLNPPAPQDRCGDKLMTINGAAPRGNPEGYSRNAASGLSAEGRARLVNARERDRCSTPERHVVVRSTTAARLGLRRDLILWH